MTDSVEQKNKRLAVRLGFLALGMIGFCIALIPLYDVLTDMSGINGKLDASEQTDVLNFTVDETRTINIDFITSVAKGVPLKFYAAAKKQIIHPGQFYDASYTLVNTSDTDINVHANPSVAPGLASAQVKLVTCFCFKNQTLKAGEEKQLSLRFVIDPQLPRHHKSIALAQQFFITK